VFTPYCVPIEFASEWAKVEEDCRKAIQLDSQSVKVMTWSIFNYFVWVLVSDDYVGMLIIEKYIVQTKYVTDLVFMLVFHLLCISTC
jgi:hypothetical protein